MMSKRFYIEIFLILIVSIVLLGLSYSKDAGEMRTLALNEKESDVVRVVSLNDMEMNQDNPSNYFNVINKTQEGTKFVVKLIEKHGKSYHVSASVDGGKAYPVNNGTIMEFSLKPYGSQGDQKSFNLFLSIDDADNTFDVVIEEVKILYLKDVIMKDKQVYLDQDNDYRYYGNNVSNYIRYNNDTYRIIGVVDNQIRLISNIKEVKMYESGDYPSVIDFVRSLDEHNLDVSNSFGKTSWLSDSTYWLNDSNGLNAYYVLKDSGLSSAEMTRSFYYRNIVNIDNKAVVVTGNGSLSSPYEVSYGSK